MFDGVNLDHLHSSILSADIEALKVAQSKLKLQQFPLDNLEVKLTFVYNLEACFFRSQRYSKTHRSVLANNLNSKEIMEFTLLPFWWTTRYSFYYPLTNECVTSLFFCPILDYTKKEMEFLCGKTWFQV